MLSQKMSQKLCTPPLIAEYDQYRVKFAVTDEEFNAAFRLRYLVFKEEQGRHVKDASSLLDTDEFDPYCAHLLVENKETHEIIGTTRLLYGPTVIENHLNFYSSQEFEIQGLENFAPLLIENGRSCVAPEYRSGIVVGMLWSGISEMMRRFGLRYLMGCASLEDTNPLTGWLLYDYFRKQNRFSTELQGIPRPQVRMERPSDEEINAYREQCPMIRKLIPPLFKGYLNMGAHICSEPVFDREFGTVDFLILADIANLPERYIRHFNVPVIK